MSNDDFTQNDTGEAIMYRMALTRAIKELDSVVNDAPTKEKAERLETIKKEIEQCK